MRLMNSESLIILSPDASGECDTNKNRFQSRVITVRPSVFSGMVWTGWERFYSTWRKSLRHFTRPSLYSKNHEDQFSQLILMGNLHPVLWCPV